MFGRDEEAGGIAAWRRDRVVIISALIVAVVVFLAVVIVVIAPLQGGTIPSTDLFQGTLGNISPAFGQEIPLQDVGLGPSGRSIFIAFVMETHMLFANLQLGGSIIIVATLLLYTRYRRERYQNLARSMTLFNLILFSTGATFAGAGMFFFISLFPTFASNAFHVYWWPLLAESILFGVEIFVLYTFWFAWGKISNRWHLVLGFVYILDVFFQSLSIDMLAAGMLTPGVSTLTYSAGGILTIPWAEALQLWFNPTLWQLQFHRVGAALGMVGFLVAALGVLHYRDRPSMEDRKQWDWVAAYGLAWGVFGLAVQAVLGYLYMFQILQSQPAAFEVMMHGARAWEMVAMVTLYSGLALAVIVYFITRRDRLLSQRTSTRLRNAFRGFLVVAAVLAFILIQPSWIGAPTGFDPTAWVNPIGLMRYKYPALFGLAAIGAVIAILDAVLLTREEKEGEWGYLTKGSWVAGLFAGLLGTAIVNVMGFVREAGRAPWTMYNIIPVSYHTPTPIPPLQIAGVWIISLSISWLIFWTVSKVTAYHPETKEQVQLEQQVQEQGDA
ncbi:MAG: cytochrome ubiquinol oxidase subunit I [Methanospirillum sp.]